MTTGRVSSLSSSSMTDPKLYKDILGNTYGRSEEAAMFSRRRMRRAVTEWGRMLFLMAGGGGLYLWRGENPCCSC